MLSTDQIICALCPQPGYCCKQFIITREGQQESFWEGETEAVNDYLKNLPQFEVDGVFSRHYCDEHKTYYVTYWFRCSALKNGRCTIYSTRPPICQNYKPFSSLLCSFYRFANMVLKGETE